MNLSYEDFENIEEKGKYMYVLSKSYEDAVYKEFSIYKTFSAQVKAIC